jgi:hypothetical protein
LPIADQCADSSRSQTKHHREQEYRCRNCAVSILAICDSGAGRRKLRDVSLAVVVIAGWWILRRIVIRETSDREQEELVLGAIDQVELARIFGGLVAIRESRGIERDGHGFCCPNVDLAGSRLEITCNAGAEGVTSLRIGDRHGYTIDRFRGFQKFGTAWFKAKPNPCSNGCGFRWRLILGGGATRQRSKR